MSHHILRLLATPAPNVLHDHNQNARRQTLSRKLDVWHEMEGNQISQGGSYFFPFLKPNTSNKDRLIIIKTRVTGVYQRPVSFNHCMSPVILTTLVFTGKKHVILITKEGSSVVHI